MILYDSSIPVSLHEFGILIPVRNSRATNTMQALLDDPVLGPRRRQWHLDQVTEPLTREDLLRVHAPDYVERLYSSGLEQELIATYELIDSQGNYHRYAPEQATQPLGDLFQRLRNKAAGSVQAGRYALEHGFCFSFTGGAHHGHYAFGHGFCLINDVVIAARKLQHEQLAKQILIIDVDAHKGDGTAALTAGDPTITTLSVHMARGWPLDGPRFLPDGSTHPSFIASDLDIPIESGEEGVYVERLQAGLTQLAQKEQPDLAIVVLGADPYEQDELPSARLINLSLEEIFARDRLIYTWLEERKIPAAFLMAGGYGESVWQVYAQFLRWVLHRRLHLQGS